MIFFCRAARPGGNVVEAWASSLNKNLNFVTWTFLGLDSLTMVFLKYEQSDKTKIQWDLKSGLVRIWNGQKEVGLQMVQTLNGI